MVTAYTPSTSAQIEPISSTASTNTPKSPTSATLRLSSEEFIPQFDDDGNQTLIKTSTGVWQVMYNGENRPVMWAYGATNILMKFDRMGRRVVKDDLRFIYDKYLQIANFEITASPICFTNDPPQRTIWDPTEPVATRPLVCNKANYSLFYIHDGNKNVREVVSHDFQIETQFNYSPFGRSFAFNNANKLQNLWRFSCEYEDTDIGILYYNFRFYDLESGRWLSRDHIGEKGGIALYVTTFNNTISNFDVACLFGEPDNSALLPNASDVKIRSLGEITHGGECIFLQGSQGSYKLIASINTHAPGRIYLNVVETSTGLKLSSRNIKKNTTKKVVYSNNTNEWFAHDSAFIISEGKRNKSFAAKFELWFSPSDGNDEYVIWSSIYRISGIN